MRAVALLEFRSGPGINTFMTHEATSPRQYRQPFPSTAVLLSVRTFVNNSPPEPAAERCGDGDPREGGCRLECSRSAGPEQERVRELNWIEKNNGRDGQI
jgi:hypothetical protein